eukprot:CAMPEP_0198293288 /NCGR_PEP_ID=MMETSP1449-20131203/16360_1 /TAXON_ID=420275 /ORGANISM="Attheya septentrionalis, Strain CCMP2084" /LENGTH=314 /DNA_ID=CAMNT_0043992815 /DNA_START=70 /DNA_END=1014 /DNA_ORIENTATION=-
MRVVETSGVLLCLAFSTVLALASSQGRPTTSFGTAERRPFQKKVVMQEVSFLRRQQEQKIVSLRAGEQQAGEQQESEKEEIVIIKQEVSKNTNNNNMGPKAAPPGVLRRSFPNLPWSGLPNGLTYLRCLAIPALVGIFYAEPFEHQKLVLSAMFAVASFTDWLDGYLARRWDITSAFGAFLDPVADKLMVSTALILLSGAWGAIVAIPTSIILAREIAVSALREWMAQRGLRDSVKVGYKGKVKTALTMVSITLCLLLEVTPIFKKVADATTTPSFNTAVAPWAIGMLWLSAYITIDSGLVYFRAAAPVLLEKE